MDGDRFDALARAFGAGRSRRGVLKGLSAAVLGTVGLSKFGSVSAASGGNSACAQWCHEHFSGSDAGHCTSDAAHGTGTCYQCGPAAPANSGQQLCNGVCTRTTSNINNCGSCGHVCTTSAPNAIATCAQGVCGITCAAGFTLCNGVCVSTSSDVANCGSCGTHCAFAHAGATCQAGVCSLGACDAGYGNCDGASADGCEANFATDPTNCGACGQVCPSGQPCVNGVCICTPTSSATACAGRQCGSVSDGCGGTLSCGSCPSGSVCDANGVCLSAATCTDGVQNGAETDIDCGGPTCPPCGNTQHCTVNSDCQSGNCVSGTCQAAGPNTCPVAGGVCGNAQSCADGQGLCVERLEGGNGCGINAKPNNIPCNECTDDAGCAALYPGVAGVFCGYPGSDCGCEGVTPNPGQCFAPRP